MSRRHLLLLALAFPVIATMASWVLFWLQDIAFIEALSRGKPLGEQLAWGLIAGLGAGALANAIEFNGRWFRRLEDIAREVFERLRPTRIDLLLVSAGAGWGEELLFRGAIQPMLGIWATAALFALAHGLLTRLSWGRVLYTAVLFFAGVGLGYLAEWAGLWAAIAAHGVYDFVVLLWAHHLFLGRGRKPAAPQT